MNKRYVTKASRLNRVSLFLFLLLTHCLILACDDSNVANIKTPKEKSTYAPLDIVPVPTYLLSGKTMGTQYNIKVVVPENFALSKPSLQTLIDEKLVAINQALSTYIPTSELSVFNDAPVGTVHAASRELFYVLNLSQDIADQSSGAFDVTIGPLVNLWGFGPDKTVTQAPSTQQINQAQALMGMQSIELDNTSQTATKRANVVVDLSAIAKGYGCDLIAELLQKNGVKNFMVEIGGEVYVQGINDRGTPWIIGVEKPSLSRTGAVQAISVSNVGIATSGDYRNYFEKNGQRISHTISPTTGAPITHNLASVTVIAETAAHADAFATAINVLGPIKGYALATEKNLAAYFLIRDGEGFTAKHTPSFKEYLATTP